MELQDVCLMFHEPDCPGMITGNGDGQLTCAEWWADGRNGLAVLEEIIGVLSLVKSSK
jgi:hypothetical protein